MSKITAASCAATTAHPRVEPLRIVVEIDAPRERVFAALTEPSQVDRWIAKGASIELEVGGKLDYGWEGEGPVKILELVPNAKLTHDWKHGNDPETIVTWTLEDSGGATRLQLVHSGFAGRARH